MRLIGMLDSPYVRRVAISIHAMGMPFEHDNWSVFGDFERFAAVNPAVKAPTLVTDDGTVLQDSTLILDYLERIAPAERRLMPEEPEAFLASQRLLGLALAACEKSVQLVYERRLRPPEKQHQPWIDRVRGQLCSALEVLESEFANRSGWRFGNRPMQADITAAVAWAFARTFLDSDFPAGRYPALHSLSGRAEATPEFIAAPLA
ncbi:glutathione S-transferase family protein [Aureimonas ureilytica]|uniref:glutathione S-transferase family protein n=1 Tax=Aureimonas ureilytica TaxID=401562 RepID=UPI000364A711|nr:glutathione S-transferase N-terminal domain-containing protein [Aureimonas ureilytica]